MDTECQACGYQRKVTDQAPDWQCPSCGKAYVKTSQKSPSPLVIYADNLSEESRNQLRDGVTCRIEPKETTLNKHGVLIGSLFSLLILVVPMLLDPSSASDILLHSNLTSVVLIFIALMGLVVLGRRVSAGVDSGNSKSVFLFAATFFGVVLAVLFFGFSISGHNEARIEAKIQHNGARTTADVVHIYSGICGRRSCGINVEYVFTPSTGVSVVSKPIHGYAELADHSNDPRVIYARTNKEVPIAYEVGHPEVSALNFNDDVFRLDHGKRYRKGIAFLGDIFLGIFLLVLVLLGFNLWLRPGRKSNVD